MPTYEISTQCGQSKGLWFGEDRAEALARMHQEAGYDVGHEDGELTYPNEETLGICGMTDDWVFEEVDLVVVKDGHTSWLADRGTLLKVLGEQGWTSEQGGGRQTWVEPKKEDETLAYADLCRDVRKLGDPTDEQLQNLPSFMFRDDLGSTTWVLS